MAPSDSYLPATPRAAALSSQLELLKRLRDRYGVSLPYEDIVRHNYQRFLVPGAVVVDVGAHVGEHLEHFLEIAWPDGHVVAFEPIPSLADGLRRRFADRAAILEIHEVALGAFEGRSEFVFATGTPGESGLKQRRFNRPDLAAPRNIEVRVRRLDDCVGHLSRLDYVKIDVEGGEVDCLKGGLGTIERHRPIISTEYGAAGYAAYGYEQETLWELAQEVGYVCLDVLGNRLGSIEEWRLACDQVYWDYYLVPSEKLELFTSRIAGTV